MDVVKTQFHVNKQPNGSMWSQLRQQAAQGGVRQLYRGVLPACLRPQALCMYTGNEWCKRLVAGDGKLTFATAPVAGFLTGYVESLCVTPFEVVKVRMQCKEHLGRYSSSLQAASLILKEEGVRALFNGLGATCARCAAAGWPPPPRTPPARARCRARLRRGARCTDRTDRVDAGAGTVRSTASTSASCSTSRRPSPAGPPRWVTWHRTWGWAASPAASQPA